MLRKANQVLTRILVSFLILVATEASAQTSGSGTAASPGALQTLTGKIRWKKSLGVIPASPRSSRQHESPCTIFWVAAAIIDGGGHRVFHSVYGLQRGRDDPDHYVCKYSMSLPVGQRFLITAGMGRGTLSAFPTGDGVDKDYSYYYDLSWIGDTDERRARLEIPDAISRSFRPGRPYVTLSKVKGTFLQFELIWDARRASGRIQ